VALFGGDKAFHDLADDVLLELAEIIPVKVMEEGSEGYFGFWGKAELV